VAVLAVAFIGLTVRHLTDPYGRGITVPYHFWSPVPREVIGEADRFLADYAGLPLEKPGRHAKIRGNGSEVYCLEYGKKPDDLDVTLSTAPLRVISFHSRNTLERGRTESYPQFHGDTQPTPEEAFAAARPILKYLGLSESPTSYRVRMAAGGHLDRTCADDATDCVWCFEYLSKDASNGAEGPLRDVTITLSLYSLKLLSLDCNSEFLKSAAQAAASPSGR
jgi:hypothetical protein